MIKKGREEEEKKKGENEEMRVYPNPEGRVSLVLKRSSDGFEGVDTWFWKWKEIRKMGEYS